MESRKFWSSYLILTIFIFLLALPAFTYAETVTKNMHKTFPLEAGGDISIENVNGNIDIISWDREEVSMDIRIEVKHGSRRAVEDFLDRVEVRFDHGRDFLNAKVDYPRHHDGGGFLSWIFGDGRPSVSVEFRVKVPREINIDLETTNGGLQVEDVIGDIKSYTTNGGIKIYDVEGKVSCRTVNGGITTEITKISRFDEMHFQTVNGSIRLGIPSDIRADLEASTVNGSIDSEIPIELRGRISRRSMRGEINGGGGYIYLKTVNGSIKIRSTR